MKKVAKYKGIYYYESAVRKWKKKPDRCFYFTYKLFGEKKREKVGWQSEGYTAETADQLRSEKIRSIRHGDLLLEERKQTFGNAWVHYEDWLSTGKAWPEDDILRYRKYLEKRFSDLTFEQISPLHLERLKSDLIKQGLAPATIKHVLVLFRQIWNKAVKWGITKLENPIRAVSLPRVQNRRERFLTEGEAQALLSELDLVSHQLFEMALLSLQTGMRAGEIFALTWSDVDVDTQTISVPLVRGGIKRSGRRVYMNRTVSRLFVEKQMGGPEDLIFPTQAGEQRSKVNRSFRSTVKRLGLNSGISDRRNLVTFHTLRHTFASWLAMKGIPLITIKELMGHSTLAMTERYSHLIPDLKRDAVSLIEFQATPWSSLVAGSSTDRDRSEHSGPSDQS